MISPQTVEHIAQLARLSLTDDERKHYAAELSAISEYFEKLNEVDTDEVRLETSAAAGPTASDEVASASAETSERIIRAAPASDGASVKVKGVL